VSLRLNPLSLDSRSSVCRCACCLRYCIVGAAQCCRDSILRDGIAWCCAGVCRCQAVFVIFMIVAVFSFGFAAADDVRKERRDQRVARSAEESTFFYRAQGTSNTGLQPS
jgi:hypothetical protein